MEKENAKTEKKDSGTAATGEALIQDVDRLKQDVARLTADARAHGRAHVDAVQQRFNQAVESAQAQLAAHPLTILGIGVALGYLFGRRKSRRSC